MVVNTSEEDYTKISESEESIIECGRTLNKENELRSEIDRLNSEISKKPRVEIVYLKPDTIIHVVEKTVKEYYKCPKQYAIIQQLQEELSQYHPSYVDVDLSEVDPDMLHDSDGGVIVND